MAPALVFGHRSIKKWIGEATAPTGVLHTGEMANGSGDPIIDLEDLHNPVEQRKFRRLCIETSAEELLQLTDVIDLHLDQVRENAAPQTDIDTAEMVAKSLSTLITSELSFEASDRLLIRGAVEYFLLHDDASSDLEDPLGFDDDARVVNSVLERIGRPELKIQPAL